MKTSIQRDNPFAPSRYAYLYEVLARHDPGRHLDYGCFDGNVIATLQRSGVIASGVGVDLNADALPRADRTDDGIIFALIGSDARSIHDVVDVGSVDSISVLDVIEHVADQRSLLADLRALLREGGKIIVTVPQQHVFSVIDGGNFKFRFPRIHKWLYLRRHDEADYHYRYVDNPHGLVGDIEKAKSWHQHFTPDELSELLDEAGFDVIDVDGAGFFHRPLVYMQRLRLPVGRLIERDMRRGSSCHLFVTALVR